MGKNHICLAGTATVGPKGQVVIPAETRAKMGIAPGDKLVALYLEDKRAIGFIKESDAQSMVDKMGDRIQSLRKKLNER